MIWGIDQTDRGRQASAEKDRETQRRARALGDPTRFAIFRSVGDGDEPKTIAALRERFSLNHTTIRQHLAILVDAGLLVESTAPPDGPGRPRLQYTVAAGVEGTWTADGPYEQLTVMLLEAMSSGHSTREVGFEHGRQAAESLKGVPDPFQAMETAMARAGFAPRRFSSNGSVELALTHCPFAHAAETDPAIVCQLHRGYSEGLAAGLGGIEVELLPQPPDSADCELRLTDGAPKAS